MHGVQAWWVSTTGDKRQIRPTRGETRTLSLAAIAVSALVLMAELDGLIGAMATSDGRTATLGGVLRPFQWSPTHEAWSVWGLLDPIQREQLAFMFRLHVVLDAVFAIAYTMLLWRLAIKTTPKWFLLALVAAEATETAVLMVFAAQLAATAQLDAGETIGVGSAVIFGATWVKGAAVLLFVLWVVAHRGDFATRAADLTQSLKTHRITGIFTLVLAVVATLPGGSILNQVPDLIRSWADTDGVWAVSMLFGATVTVAFFLTSLLVGRMRSVHVLKDEMRGGGPPPLHRLRAVWWPLVLGFAVVGAMALLSVLVVMLGGASAEMNAPVIGVILVTSIVLTGVSFIFRNYATPPGVGAREKRPPAALTFRVGDHLAVAAIALSGISLARAVLPPVVVAVIRKATTDAGDESEAVRLAAAATHGADLALGVFGILGMGLAILAWPIWHQWRNRTVFRREVVLEGGRGAERMAAADGSGNRPVVDRRILWRVAVAAALIVVVVSVAPAWTVWLGAQPLFVLLVAAWMAILGAVVVWFQDVQPIGVFRWLRLRRTPVILLIATMMLVSSILGQGEQHLVRAEPAASAQSLGAAPVNAVTRPNLSEAFAAWASVVPDAACGRAEGPRPLTLVAAQGGGIRAAYWTALVYQDLLADDCARSSLFLSSGVSGGAVGLAMSLKARRDASNDDFAAGRLAEATVTDASRSDALAVAIAGTLAGDVLASATGIRIPVAGATEWKDRAAQMQDVWVARQNSLSGSFVARDDLRGAGGGAPEGGWAVLNSTDARTGCRVLISQVRLDAPAEHEAGPAVDITGSREGTPPRPRCNDAGDVAISIDLLGELPAWCPLNPTWATAMTLAARFPVVSPAGGVPGDCGAAHAAESHATTTDPKASESTMQLVDGGYSDNSGLGTLADSAAPLARLIQEWNECVAAAPTKEDRDPCAEDDARPILPVVLYVRNEEGADVRPAPLGSIPELLVPLYGMDANAMHGSEDAGLQRLRGSLVGAAGGGGPTTYIVAPRTYPSVVPPLGWYLSERSRTALKENLALERRAASRTSERGHGSYSAFLDAVRAP